LLKRIVLKRLITILLILSLAVPFFVPFAVLYHQKKQIRKEVKERIIAGLDKKDLVLLTFSADEAERELSWHHSREFEYEGEMYDVVEAIHTEDGVSYWCWHDKKEKFIDEKLDELVAKTLMNDPQNKENQKRVSSFLNLPFFLWNDSWDSIEHYQIRNSTTDNFSYYSSVFIPPPSPPPKFS
jgi:hypothetical protein